MLRAINPATGHLLAEYPLDSNDDVARKLTLSHEACSPWRLSSYAERAILFHNVAAELRSGAHHYARRMTDEMGKPIRQALAEVEKCAWACEYFAENAARFLQPQRVDTEASKSYVAFEPLGSILAVMPWNFPFWQFFRFAAPALMAGNVAVLKHAPNVPGCALDIEEIFANAGFPQGVLVNLFINDRKVADVIRDHHIAAVTLTGSVGAGRSVAATAGEVIKKCVLELGGSDPFIVLKDCDLDLAVEQAAVARMLNNGQSCIAAKRFIVEKPVYERFIDAFRARLERLVVGDPHLEETEVGPLARKDLRDELHRQVKKSIKRGAQCLLGGEVLEGDGFFYAPTLLIDVDPEMLAFEQETFGPVAAVTLAENTAHAIELANRSEYGLGASIWTRSARGEDLARQLNAGHVAVNDIVKSDPRLPFGGVKKSGYGRELSAFGAMEFCNVKTYWIK